MGLAFSGGDLKAVFGAVAINTKQETEWGVRSCGHRVVLQLQMLTAAGHLHLLFFSLFSKED